MRHTTYFKGIESTEAIENYLDKRLKNLDKLVRDDGAHATVELGKTTEHHKQGDVFRAEIHLHTKGKEFYIAVEKDDLYSAIDEMRDAITLEIKKFKGKSETIFRRSARTVKDIMRGLDPRGFKSFKFWKKK